MKSPLLIGTDLTVLTQDEITLLQNPHLLAFNQDPVVGKPAKPYKWGINEDWTFNSTVPAMYWSGASSKGIMVAMFNPLPSSQSMRAEWSEVPELGAGNYNVLDVWTGEQSCQEGGVDVELASHDTAVYLLTRDC